MVPGDLPVFLRIGLDSCLKQDNAYLREVIVVPDKSFPQFRNYYEEIKRQYTYHFKLQIVALSPLEQLAANSFNSSALNVWLQFMAGVNHCSTEYIIWHDADAFITNPEFFKMQEETMRARSLCALGVSEAWDSWFRENGLPHVVATWELMMRMEWILSFKPWQVKPRFARINGKIHGCDMLYYAQSITAPDKIGRNKECEGDLIHFNWVISAYRRWQNGKGKRKGLGTLLRLFLIRMLVESYDNSNWECDIPPLTALAAEIRLTNETEQKQHNEFINRLVDLVESPFFDIGVKDKLRERITLLPAGSSEI
jgi:glycosyltransferase involved in cell wall biosynthesis